uniref:Glutathione peroxidase n=1 Tax=Acrobeloides nanus TaxID=290746 RepID=A0A914DQI2_9BILA
MTAKTIYQFTAKDVDGKDVNLEKYMGNVVLIVNVASECGLTNSNYTQLKEVLDKYHDKGLQIAAFPCNQFGGEEPACELDIKKFVNEKYKFEPDLYAKIKVNGDDAHPLYKFLKKEKGGTLFDGIKWNFTKFLVDKEGHVVKRYAPTTAPHEIEKDIEKLL